MNKYELFDAMTGIDEDLLERSEHKAHKRLSLRKPLIAAAAVMLLAVTVLAAPAIRDFLFRSDVTMVTEGGRHVYGDLYIDIDDDVYRIDLPIEEAENLPVSIEEVRIPLFMIENDWLVSYGEIDAVYSDAPVRFKWWDRNSPKWITFEQKCIPQDGDFPGAGTFELETYHGAQLEKKTLDISGIEFVYYSIPSYRNEETWEAYARETAVYWTDGEYAYHLQCSLDVPPEELAQIVLSVGTVEDVAPYLKNNPKNDGMMLEQPDLDIYKMPTHIPEGYELKVCVDNGWHINWIWENDEGHTFSLVESHEPVQTEVTILEMVLKGSEYTREESERYGTTLYTYTYGLNCDLFWEEGPRCSSGQMVNFFGHVYYFQFRCGGSLSREEMLAVTDSMTVVEDLTPYLTQ